MHKSSSPGRHEMQHCKMWSTTSSEYIRASLLHPRRWLASSHICQATLEIQIPHAVIDLLRCGCAWQGFQSPRRLTSPGDDFQKSYLAFIADVTASAGYGWRSRWLRLAGGCRSTRAEAGEAGRCPTERNGCRRHRFWTCTNQTLYRWLRIQPAKKLVQKERDEGPEESGVPFVDSPFRGGFHCRCIP